jgi:hypothetical protein
VVTRRRRRRAIDGIRFYSAWPPVVEYGAARSTASIDALQRLKPFRRPAASRTLLQKGIMMRPVAFGVLSRLDLAAAAREEAAADEPLIPPVPGREYLTSADAGFVRWLTGQLESGMATSRGLIVHVPKTSVGSRPVAVWGLAERTVYRALVNVLLDTLGRRMDRSRAAYQIFVAAPLEYAKTLPPSPRVASTDRFSAPWPEGLNVYVVKADITAFYEYVDHDILGRELLVQTGEHAVVDCLLDLLAGVQGRRYGLPQLLGPSDELSDIYIQRVHRAIRRRGWPAWRYNDDFRIAVESFADAKDPAGYSMPDEVSAGHGPG